MTTLTCQ